MARPAEGAAGGPRARRGRGTPFHMSWGSREDTGMPSQRRKALGGCGKEEREREERVAGDSESMGKAYAK